MQDHRHGRRSQQGHQLNRQVHANGDRQDARWLKVIITLASDNGRTIAVKMSTPARATMSEGRSDASAVAIENGTMRQGQ